MNVHWKSSKSGDWSSPSKWSGGVVPGSADSVDIGGAGGFTVTISTAVAAVTLDIHGAGVTVREVAGGSLGIGNNGGITVRSGATLALGTDNTALAGYTSIQSASLEVGSAGALGATTLDLFDGASVRWLVSSTLTNSLGFYHVKGTSPVAATLAAAHQTTLTIASAAKIGVATDIVLGSAADDGRIILASKAGAITGSHKIEIAGGTLALGSKDATGFFHSNSHKAVALAIDSGATFDLAGRSAELDHLIGSGGDIVTSTGAPTLVLHDATAEIATSFSGALKIELAAPDQTFNISGSALLDGTGGLVLADDTVAQFESQFAVREDGQIVIGQSATLQLDSFFIDGGISVGDNATLSLYGGGSIGNGISFVSNGYLDIDSDNSVTIAGNINGGHFQQRGTGTLTLTGVNTLTGGFVDKGTLQVALGASLGNGSTTFNSGSTLEALGTTTISSRIVLLTATVAAAHGTTLTLAGETQIAYGDTTSFGNAGFDGTIVYTPNKNSGIDGEVDVHAGTFVLGNARAATLIAGSDFLQVDAGATLDLHGQYASAQQLVGAGTIVNNGNNYDSLSLGGGVFSGTITGGIAVEMTGNTRLSGTGNFDALYIDDGVSAVLDGNAGERIYMYDGDCVLVLGAASHLTGKINDFASGDAIRLEALHYSASANFTFDAASQKLTVNDSAGHSVVLTFQDNHVAGDFSLVQATDGSVEVRASNHVASVHAFEPQYGAPPTQAFAPVVAQHAEALATHAFAQFDPHLHLAMA